VLKLAVCLVLSNLISCCNLLFSTCSYTGVIGIETNNKMTKSFTSNTKWFCRETIFIIFQSNEFNLNFCTTKTRQIQLPLKLIMKSTYLKYSWISCGTRSTFIFKAMFKHLHFKLCMKRGKLVWITDDQLREGGGGKLVPQVNFCCINNLGVTNTLYLGEIHRVVIKK